MVKNTWIGIIMILGPFIMPTILLLLFRKFNIQKNINIIQNITVFIIGGFSSGMIAMAFNDQFLKEGNFYLLGVFAGITEEFVKTLVTICMIKWMKQCKSILDGLIIGAAVGGGFSALESIFYASRYMWLGGFELMMKTIILRNILTLGSHIAWNMIVGAVIVILFYRNNKIYSLLFLLCIVMHVLWNMISIFSLHVCLTIAAWLVIVVLIDEGMDEAYGNIVKNKK